MKKILLLITVFAGLAIGTAFATSWSRANIDCPICKTTNEFHFLQGWGSSGASTHAQLQHIHWLEENRFASVRTCKNCRYTAFMWNFSNIDSTTIGKIQKALPYLELPAQNYSDCITKRLANARQIYKLYRYDDADFWNDFYRVQGFHYARIRNVNQAETARLKALAITSSLLTIPENEYRKKELLFIASSMRYFTNREHDKALKDIDLALTMTYNNPNLQPYQNERLNSHLTRQLEHLKWRINNRQ